MSVLQQSFRDFEVLLVDANRRAPPVAENPRLTDLLIRPGIRILNGRGTHNAASARNVGLRAARGEWITFLDDDDAYHPEKLEAQHKLATRTGAALVLCGYEFLWPKRRRIRQTEMTTYRRDELLTHAYLGSPALFHRRDSALQFDENLTAGEDVPYALRFIVRHGIHEVPNVPRSLIVVHPQPRGMSVHGDKEAVWHACRASWRIARPCFSRAARRTLLANGRLERAIGGHGTFTEFCRRVVAVLRTRGLREWRLAVFAVLARLRR